MDYKIEIPQFNGPLDLLLHLIKQSNLNIEEICIEDITKQYLLYINMMEKMNLNIASEYLVMAAELLEIKSSSLLPKREEEIEDDYEDPKEILINKLLAYNEYKNLANNFKELEEYRQEIYTREPENLTKYKNEDEKIDFGVNLDDLLNAFSKIMAQKEINKPLNTKITNKEYNIEKRCIEIKNILKKSKKVNFTDLFEINSKEYIIVTFLAVLSMSKNQEIQIEQEYNFNDIIIRNKGDF